MSAPLFLRVYENAFIGIWNIWEPATDYGTNSNLVIFRLISNCIMIIKAAIFPSASWGNETREANQRCKMVPSFQMLIEFIFLQMKVYFSTAPGL